MCATVSDPVLLGTDIEVDIQLVFDNHRQSEPLRVPARVVWCTAVDDGHQVGIRFLPLDTEKADYLTMFLRYLDEGSEVEDDRTTISIDDRFG